MSHCHNIQLFFIFLVQVNLTLFWHKLLIFSKQCKAHSGAPMSHNSAEAK